MLMSLSFAGKAQIRPDPGRERKLTHTNTNERPAAMRTRLDKEDQLLDEYDEIEIDEALASLELRAAPHGAHGPRGPAGTLGSRWRSVEEYQEWRELARQLREVYEPEAQDEADASVTATLH